MPPCVTQPHLRLFDGLRALPLFEPPATSHILRNFFWSPLVQSAIAHNFALLRPPSAKDILALDPNKLPPMALLLPVPDTATLSAKWDTGFNPLQGLRPICSRIPNALFNPISSFLGIFELQRTIQQDNTLYPDLMTTDIEKIHRRTQANKGVEHHNMQGIKEAASEGCSCCCIRY